MIREEVNPTSNVESGKFDIRDSSVRDTINNLIDGVTNQCFVTPYIALERVSKVLAYFHIHLPKYTFMEGESGLATFPINQFGNKMGMTNDGVVVSNPKSDYTLWFEYRTNDEGLYDIFCSLVTDEDMSEMMADMNDETELDEATLAGPETGARKKPGSSTDSEQSYGIDPEDLTSDEMSDLVKTIVKRAMKPGIKFAGDEAGSKEKPSSSLTEADSQPINPLSGKRELSQDQKDEKRDSFIQRLNMKDKISKASGEKSNPETHKYSDGDQNI